jgi:peptidoglycan lytic transglycosylase
MYKQIISAIFLLLITLTQISAIERGEASWYGGKFQGRQTANGEKFDTNMLTAAHKTLPFNTIVEVKNLENDKIVHVRINDRGPFVVGRIIDLSRAAASKLDMVGAGHVRVEVRIIDDPSELTNNADHNIDTGLLQHDWIIQIASFSNKEYAEKVLQKLKSNSFNPEIEMTSTGYTRILLKNISNSELETTKTKLTELSFTGVLLRKP